MTLPEFLLDRIADEEWLAHDAASEGTPSRTGWQLWTSKKSTTPGGEVLGPRGSIEMSPSRALAECEAKRRIVQGLVADMEEDYAPWNEEHLKVLALPYADHPDYDEAWRPEPVRVEAAEQTPSGRD